MASLLAGEVWRGPFAPVKTVVLAVLVAGITSGCNLGQSSSNGGVSGVAGDSIPMNISSPTDDVGSTSDASPTNDAGSTNDSSPRIGLSWNPNPVAVDGYSVYYGGTSETVDHHYADYAVDAGEVDPANPELQLSAFYDLGLRAGEQVCFSIQAYNSNGASGLSTPVCAMVN